MTFKKKRDKDFDKEQIGGKTLTLTLDENIRPTHVLKDRSITVWYTINASVDYKSQPTR